LLKLAECRQRCWVTTLTQRSGAEKFGWKAICIHPGQHDLVALNLLNKSSLQQTHTYTQGQQVPQAASEQSVQDQESSSPSTAAPPSLRSQKGQTHTIHASRYPKAVSLLLFTPTDRLPGSIKSTACGEVAFAYRPTKLSTSSSGTDNRNLSLM